MLAIWNLWNSLCLAAHNTCALWEIWRPDRFLCWEGNGWNQEAVCSVWCEGFEQNPQRAIKRKEEGLKIYIDITY